MNPIARKAIRPSAGAVDCLVVGAGHAGLAMSRCLDERGVDHLVLERGVIANSWKHERWDSLRLLTPNWQTRLPGYRYDGADPDGFMTAAGVADFIDGYARFTAAPVHTQTAVTDVIEDDDGFRVTTNRGSWRCRALVIASGAHNLAAVPVLAGQLPASVASVDLRSYRSPEQLDPRGVLVVGASASGVQIASEIRASGRPVTLAVGEHIRLPRLYRGRDIQWWMDALGILDERYDRVDDIVRARRVPSPQLVGNDDRSSLDLNVLTAAGVETVGRLAGISDGHAQFSGSLRNHCAMADLKLNRLLDSIDLWIGENGLDAETGPPARPAPTRVPDSPRLKLDLTGGRIGTVVWATGFRPDYSWLRLPVLDRKGRLRHDGGVVDAPGVYAMGLNFMRRRKSSFIHGAADDAADLADHLVGHLACPAGHADRRAANW